LAITSLIKNKGTYTPVTAGVLLVGITLGNRKCHASIINTNFQIFK